MIKKIATQAVYVEDQQKALTFWTEQVGFEVRANHPMGPNAFWIEVAPQGAESCLVLYPKSMMNDWAERKPSIVFETDDIDKTYEQLKANGVNIEEPMDLPFSRFTKFYDLDGNWFGLKQANK